jgi:homoserine O-acetyltransferase
LVRARMSDANSFLYLTRANQLFLNEYDSRDAALARSRAKWLVMPSVTDRVFPVEYGHELATALKGMGQNVQAVDLRGPLGHLEGVANIAQAAAAIRTFLAR